MELAIATIMTDKDIGLGEDGRMAERPWAIPVKPDLRGNEGQIVGFTFWASHLSYLNSRRITKDAIRAKVLEKFTVTANLHGVQQKLSN